jgi:hypothetical protein
VGLGSVKEFFFLFDLEAEFFFRGKDQAISGGEKLAVFFENTVLDQGFILIGAQDNTNGGVITGNLFEIFEHPHIHIELSDVLVGESGCF